MDNFVAHIFNCLHLKCKDKMWYVFSEKKKTLKISIMFYILLKYIM